MTTIFCFSRGFLGFGGAMTWQRAPRIRELAATLPLEDVVRATTANAVAVLPRLSEGLSGA